MKEQHFMGNIEKTDSLQLLFVCLLLFINNVVDNLFPTTKSRFHFNKK
jgi:hypothetical protein